MKNTILNVGSSQNTVFSINELSQFIEHSSDSSLRLKISNYANKGYIEKVTRGIYSLPNRNINPFELANKIYSPSYISFFSALYHHGVIFQANPSEIDIAYKKSDTKKISDLQLKINIRCLKENILLNNEGLIFNGIYTIASAERAFLDTIYLYNNIYFDNIDILDLNKIIQLTHIYGRDKMMYNRIKRYFPNIKIGPQ